MTIHRVPIDSITPDPANARRHSARQLKALAASLRRFGQQKPIVLDGNGVVRAGNGTLAAARALGWRMIDIVRSTLRGAELTAYAIADNRLAELAEWDDSLLRTALADPAIGDVGFTAAQLAKLNASIDDIEDVQIPASYQLVVECADEAAQRTLYERLRGEGFSCRVLTM